MGNHQAPPTLQQQFLCFHSTERVSAQCSPRRLLPAAFLTHNYSLPVWMKWLIQLCQPFETGNALLHLAAPVSWWAARDVMQHSSSPRQHPGGAGEAEAQLHRKVLVSPGVRSPSPRAHCLYKAGRVVKLEGKIAHRVFKLLFEVMQVPVMLLLHLFNGHFCLYAHV